jgi:Fe-S cluster assembly protein SufD
VSEVTQRYLAQHDAFAKNGGGGVPSWVKELRAAAMARFSGTGFPTTKEEDWRFTSVQKIADGSFALVHGAGVMPVARDVHAHELCEAHRHLLVFVNGKFAPSLSSIAGLPAGVRIGSLAEAFGSDAVVVQQHLAKHAWMANPFTSLNTAFMRDGGYIHIPANVVLDEPVQLLYLSVAGATPSVSHPRTLIVADRLARASVVETYAGIGEGVYWTNAVTEIIVGDGARVDCYRVQREGAQAYHVAATHTHQGRDATVHLHPVVLGGALTRHDIGVVMNGENGLSVLNGLYVLGQHQHVDHHTTIDHAKPHCESHEYFNGILDDHSRGVFNGRIIVRPGAQRTDSKQTNNNLVLSEEARADSQPQLEIYADDVKCTHGATLGPIDEKAMFYLTSRGIPSAEARSLLTYGFGAEIIDRMEIAPLQATLDRLIRRRLLGAASAA